MRRVHSCMLPPHLTHSLSFPNRPTDQNVYDELLDTNGTPSLPELPAELYTITAAQVGKKVHDMA